MKNAIPPVIYSKDYHRPPYLIKRIEMKFELFEDQAMVTGTLTMKQREKAPLILHGEGLELLSLQLMVRRYLKTVIL